MPRSYRQSEGPTMTDIKTPTDRARDCAEEIAGNLSWLEDKAAHDHERAMENLTETIQPYLEETTAELKDAIVCVASIFRLFSFQF